MMQFLRKNRGLTLIEIVVVLVITAILAAAATGKFNFLITRSQGSSVQSTFEALKLSTETYYSDNGKLPTLAAFNNTSDIKFTDLRQVDTNVSLAQSVDELDPWGHPYYMLTDTGAQPKIWFISLGKDGKFAANYQTSFEDDILLVVEKNA